MFGLPIVLAALALMGAPAIPVACNPDEAAAHAAEGITWLYGVPGNLTPLRIAFSARVCAGLTYLAASPDERVKLRALNPGLDFDYAAGIALVAALHEAHHASGDMDEARTQCFAMKNVAAFAAVYAPPDELALMLSWAQAYDAALPPAYHGGVC